MIIWRNLLIAGTIGIVMGLALGWSPIRYANSQAENSDHLVGVVSVIDGDTLDMRGTRLRLHGIDAPEGAQLCLAANNQQWRCGQQAALKLADHIGRSTIACEAKGRDQYRRIVAVCRRASEDLNAWMVREGWAVAYRQYSQDYVTLEEAAKAQRKNIWSGTFVMPWDWRRGQRLEQTTPLVGEQVCSIKGNISSKGERIYHVPGGKWYAQTQINTGAGERWFCSETEARNEGWRRSSQ